MRISTSIDGAVRVVTLTDLCSSSSLTYVGALPGSTDSLEPTVVIPNAKIVSWVAASNLPNATGSEPYAASASVSDCEGGSWIGGAAIVERGEVWSMDGQCLRFSLTWHDLSRCVDAHIIEVRYALIGDFCARFGARSVTACYGYNKAATLPPGVSAKNAPRSSAGRATARRAAWLGTALLLAASSVVATTA